MTRTSASFNVVKQPRLADAIVDELERMLIEGVFVPGEKLPSERELAAQFNVSRPSLREAIQKLEAKGLLIRKQGGGTFVSESSWESVAEPLFQLMAHHPESQFDLLEFRHALEGICAYYAAVRGTETDDEQLAQCIDSIGQVELSEATLTEHANAVMAFHLKMAEASHNVVVLQVMLCLKPLLQQNIEENLTQMMLREDAQRHVAEHRRHLLAMIVERKPELARQASHEHLAYIEEAMLDVSRETTRVERSLRRVRSSNK
ncbi:pyruvate dehydrogenase complex transcriptional repressor PdhR [Echinimonas agarilytica]|uniref:Pyruvate dehydrogenase complex repressor n=1 Tax=Echinimonas agarilytica TaxID=1215918 RepID=A0AA41W536_9GAMM|nr:pyruvate dehydrogenase complex transcriptional repressor PdhR [Echinimonas agarilytica]MCM2678800.1 pyruvate dehydrogenase complex transcriptional repressor PdhR [Echinimonas agarilytica]